MFKYQTQVKIDVPLLQEIAKDLYKLYHEADPTGELRKANKNNSTITPQHTAARSLFSQWNNIQHFADKLSSSLITVTGEAKGNSSRIYFKPSITSLAKPFRKCIIPLDSSHKFLFFDLRAAEFFMNCVFANEQEAIDAYHKGEDIYMHYAYLFPLNTPRKVIKKILIANMYNQTAYSVARDLSISETQAQRLLDSIAFALPNMTMLKRRIIAYDLKHRGYFAPKGFDQTTLIKVADINPAKGFSHDFALSAYTQSALGFFMHDLTTRALKKTKGTLLSVFDSMLIEIDSVNFDRAVSWFTNQLSPFVADKYNLGSTFWEAAYSQE